MAPYHAGQADAECVRGELRWPPTGRVPERDAVHVDGTGPRTARSLAAGLQHVRPHSKLGGRTPAQIAGQRVWEHAEWIHPGELVSRHRQQPVPRPAYSLEQGALPRTKPHRSVLPQAQEFPTRRHTIRQDRRELPRLRYLAAASSYGNKRQRNLGSGRETRAEEACTSNARRIARCQTHRDPETITHQRPLIEN